MEQSPETIAEQSCYQLGGNLIGDEGCRYLALIATSNLDELSISTSNPKAVHICMGGQGCRHLSKAHWPELKTLNCSMCWQMQTVTELGHWHAGTSARHDGRPSATSI
jgi:hypothetical protein